MTGTPHTAPEEVPVVMGQGEYAPDPDDHRVRRVGTPLHDASLGKDRDPEGHRQARGVNA